MSRRLRPGDAVLPLAGQRLQECVAGGMGEGRCAGEQAGQFGAGQGGVQGHGLRGVGMDRVGCGAVGEAAEQFLGEGALPVRGQGWAARMRCLIPSARKPTSVSRESSAVWLSRSSPGSASESADSSGTVAEMPSAWASNAHTGGALDGSPRRRGPAGRDAR